uniref:Metallo-beta-lactamase domain containing 2 n=1 Tax=Cyanistes caeruleus TaxID=156563 RepID=A0A8C0VC07_CYACU
MPAFTYLLLLTEISSIWFKQNHIIYFHVTLQHRILFNKQRDLNKYFLRKNKNKQKKMKGRERESPLKIGRKARSEPCRMEMINETHFDEVAVHSAEAAALLHGDNYEAVTWLSDREVARPPRPGWSARQFRVQPVRPSRLLQEGDVISLGDRQLTVMHMPGHSRGSICLHDKDRKILFSGDVVYDGSMIDWLPYSRISDYVVSCQRLMELVDRGLVEKVLPGHFNMFGAERLYRLASNYISQAGVCHKISTCAMKSIASIALHVANSRISSQ